jgi:hypothetical protein
VTQIEEFFTSRYEDAELAELAELLARVDGDETVDCSPSD